MGVTIHFEGKLKDQRSLADAVALAVEFSNARGWRVQFIDQPEATLLRFEGALDWEYVGPVTGGEVQAHEDAEHFRLVFDRDLFVQEFVKTQFAPIEIHVQLVELLHLLKPFFQELRVEDEGEYFQLGDVTLLQKHRDHVSEALNEVLALPSKYHGRVRLASWQIVDLTDPKKQ